MFWTDVSPSVGNDQGKTWFDRAFIAQLKLRPGRRCLAPQDQDLDLVVEFSTAQDRLQERSQHTRRRSQGSPSRPQESNKIKQHLVFDIVGLCGPREEENR